MLAQQLGYMKRFLLPLFALFFLSPVFAQGPYELSFKTDGFILGGSALIWGTSLVIQQDVTPLTIQEINALDKNDINSFDRFAANNWSESAALRSNIAFYSTAAFAASGSLIYPYLRKDSEFFKEVFTVGSIWLETNILTYGFTHMAKVGVLRSRPFAYNKAAPLSEKLDIDARKSFFSGHTSMTTANAFFAAKVFNDYYPESKWKPVVWTAAVLVPAYTAWERVNAGKHFPTDVMAAYAVGALCGYFIPHLHKRVTGKERAISFFPSGGKNYSGMAMVWRM